VLLLHDVLKKTVQTHLNKRQWDGSSFINNQQLCLREAVGVLRLDVLHRLQHSNNRVKCEK
jgi:hypothetical protein